MSQSSDVLIIGGGVIGLTTAYFLAREGLRVRILDKGSLGQEASWAGAGILTPGNLERATLPIDKLRAQSYPMFAPLSADLRERTGIDNGYLRCGGIEFAEPGNPHIGNPHIGNPHIGNPHIGNPHVPHVGSGEWCGEGADAHHLSADQTHALEAAVPEGLGDAVHFPGMAQLRNPRHLKALIAACQQLNVDMMPGCLVHALAKKSGQIEGVRTSAGVIRAGTYILASGAWSSALLEPLGLQTAIRPIRGQIALLNPGKPLFRRILVCGPRYLVPRPDGRVLVGSTEEDVGFDKSTTAAALQSLLQLALRIVPALGDAGLERSWAGLRPGSPDGLPYIGPVPGYSNLFVNAGHFRSGIQLSPASALLLKEQILGQPATLPIEPFLIDRAART